MRSPYTQALFTRVSTAALLAAVTVAAATQAAAQSTQTTNVDEIVVTGTSIRGVAAVGQPAVNVDREAIAATGASNIAAVARTLPVVLNIGADESRTTGAQDAGANSSRISAINLRGLGPEATLVLLNGRRLAPGGVLRALTDPAMISAGSTERVEVVLDGSSAVYGADAVAGVVNLITRRRFDGAETSARYGAGKGLDEMQISQTFGKTWSTGDVFASVEYSDRSNLDRADRDFLTQDLRAYGGLDQRSFQAETPNVVVGANRLPLPGLTGASNRYDAGKVGDFLPQQKRINGFLSARQDVTEDLQVWYEGFFSRRRIINKQAPLGGAFSVPASNPFYRAGVPGIAPGANQSIEYRLPRAGATVEGKEVGAQSAVGFRWNMPAEWQANGYVSRSHDEAVTGLGSEQLNNFAIPIALRDTNPATALNVYGGPISDALYARIIGFRLQKSDALQHDAQIKFDGPLFATPGGTVRAAVGAAFQKSSYRYQEYQSVLSATNTPSTTNDRKNHREVTSVFGELFIPLVSADNELPFVQRFDISVAGRYDDYSDFGDTFNPKVSASWDVGAGVSLRGSWGKSFRAPSLVDTGNLNFVFVNVVPDPANGNAPITQVSWNGSNAVLDPERAKTYSVGFDWRPPMLSNLTVSGTYYKVNYRDRIQGIAASLASENIYRQFITRNPDPALIQQLFNSGWLVSTPVDPTTVGVLVDGRRANVGTLIQDGLDLDVRYRIPTDFGSFTVGVAHSETFHVKRITTPGGPTIETVNLFENPLRSRGRASLTWIKDNFVANAFYNYGGSYTNTGVTPNRKVKFQNTFDLSAAYTFEEGARFASGLRIQISATNLFDKDPPTVINGTNAWDNTTANAIGRFVALDITKRW